MITWILNALRFTEHWLREDHLSSVYIDQFRLVSRFSRSSRKGGGSGIFVRNFSCTKDVEYLKGLGSKNAFELLSVELLDFNFILAYIYRFHDGDFYEFLHKLELEICKVQTKGKHILLCGDWNISYLQRSVNYQNYKIPIQFANTMKSPTRIMHNTSSLTDVMITNNLILKSKL